MNPGIIKIVAWVALIGCGLASAQEPPSDPPAPPNKSATEQAFQKMLKTMGVRYLPDRKRIEVDGWVNMQKGLVEVFACAPGGKTHEAVVVIECVPSGLHAGLLALGLKPGTPVETGTDADYKFPTGDGVLVQVRWTDKGGKEATARAEDWIWHAQKEKTMEHVAWTFAGSFMQQVSGKPQDATYAANSVKSLVTTYHDPSSILENPLPEGRDDALYYANEKAVPAVNTPVIVTFTAAPKGKSSAPVKGKSSAPVKGKSSAPLKGKSSAPEKRD